MRPPRQIDWPECCQEWLAVGGIQRQTAQRQRSSSLSRWNQSRRERLGKQNVKARSIQDSVDLCLAGSRSRLSADLNALSRELPKVDRRISANHLVVFAPPRSPFGMSVAAESLHQRTQLVLVLPKVAVLRQTFWKEFPATSRC